MTRVVLRALSFAVLAYAYDQGILIALVRFNALELPWMPYLGKSPVAVALLVHTASALAVLCLALPVGGAAAACAGARPFWYALGVAAPAFADQAYGVPPLVGKTLFTALFSGMYCLEVLLPMLLLPALVAWLARRLLQGMRARRTPPPVSG
jgi:hypothetical protein